MQEKMQISHTDITTDEWHEGYGLECQFHVNFTCELSPWSGHFESTVQTISLCCLAIFFLKNPAMTSVCFLIFNKLWKIQGTGHFRGLLTPMPYLFI